MGVSLLFVPGHATKLEWGGRRVHHDGVMYADLQRVAEAPAVRGAFARCAPLTAADHRPIPFVRYWLDGAPGSVRTVEGGASPMSRLLLLPRRNKATRRVYSLKTFPIVRAPDGYTQIYRNASWRVYAAPGC
jgi:hypothetical protein